MYSYEIDELLKSKNYVITHNDYKCIIASSQIISIKYDPYSDDFCISTDDRYNWRFRVVNKGM